MVKNYRVRLVKQKSNKTKVVKFVHSPWSKAVPVDENTKVLGEWRFSCREQFLVPFLKKLERDFISEGDLFIVVCAPSLDVFIH